MIRPANPSDARRSLIPIGEGRGASRTVNSATGGKSDPYAFWADYYRKHDESAAQLRETVRLLNVSRKFKDVHAALKGYLTYRGKNAEPWMYEAFALAVEEVGGSPEDVKQALNYAADMAQHTHNPNHLVRAADLLYLKGHYERVSALLDEASAKVPHRAEPIVMSINLAQKTKDPGRMSDSIDRLLSLGWPGNDEYFRKEASNQAEQLAKVLREENRGEESSRLLAKLPESLSRDVFVRLSWDGEADFDLVVQEPLGATAQYDLPRTVFGGSLIKNGYGNHPEEIYVCPRGFDGDYTIRISMIFTNPAKPPTRLTLETITHEGTAQEKKETISISPENPKTRAVVVHLNGGRRKSVLPFVSPMAILQTPGLIPGVPKVRTGKPIQAGGNGPASLNATRRNAGGEAPKR